MNDFKFGGGILILADAYSGKKYFFVVEDIGYDWKYLARKKIFLCRKGEGKLVFQTAKIYASRVEALLEISHRRWKDAVEGYVTHRNVGDGIWWNW